MTKKKMIIIFVVIGLFLGIFHKSFYENSGSFLGPGFPSTVGRGYPFQYIVWDVSWPEHVKGYLTASENAAYPDALTFDITLSIIGLVIDVLFWVIFGFISLTVSKRVLKNINTKTLKTLFICSIIFTGFTFFLTSWDGSSGIVTSRGAPFSYLLRQSISNPPYYSPTPEFDLFYFICDILFFYFFLTLGYKIRNHILSNTKNRGKTRH
jgi:hypothetical protein